MLSSPFMIAKRLAPACSRESPSAQVFVPNISKVTKPANNRLKLTARGKSVAESRLRTRAAA
jgi:hypothetical protein